MKSFPKIIRHLNDISYDLANDDRYYRYHHTHSARYMRAQSEMDTLVFDHVPHNVCKLIAKTQHEKKLRIDDYAKIILALQTSAPLTEFFCMPGDAERKIQRAMAKFIDDQHGIIKTPRVNIFEIFPITPGADTSVGLTQASFDYGLKQIELTMWKLSSGMSSQDIAPLDDFLRKFYIYRGMWSLDPKDHFKSLQILKLPHNQYPTLSEFKVFMYRQIQSDEHIKDAHAYRIYNICNMLIKCFGNELDGHTNVSLAQAKTTLNRRRITDDIFAHYLRFGKNCHYNA